MHKFEVAVTVWYVWYHIYIFPAHLSRFGKQVGKFQDTSEIVCTSLYF